MARKSTMVLDSDELAKLNSVPYLFLHIDALVDFLADHHLSYVDNLFPILSAVQKEVAKVCGTQSMGFGTGKLTLITACPISWSVMAPWTAAASTKLISPSISASAVVTVHFSSSQCAPVSIVSTTITAASAASSGHPSTSFVRPLSVQQLLFHGNTVLKGVQRLMNLVCKERDDGNRLSYSRIYGSDNVRSDYLVLSATTSACNFTVARLGPANFLP